MNAPFIVTQPENGGPYTLNRPMTRAEMLDALHACQDGRASCLYTLKVFEAHIDMVAQEDIIALDEIVLDKPPHHLHPSVHETHSLLDQPH